MRPVHHPTLAKLGCREVRRRLRPIGSILASFPGNREMLMVSGPRGWMRVVNGEAEIQCRPQVL